QDMALGKPMDRLVCGDVGFGKTEVALRAAFVAAMAGKQVAVTVPTTLLARQHAANFTERFKGFPIRIGQLSRMVSTKDANLTKKELEDGICDVVIGTHSLLSESVKFKDLGLLIVDEEQRFGVKQKERLKNLRETVHVLTLSATPIPRTLQLAVSGVKELSLIATPPVDRLAVRTFVMPWDGMIIREALMREHFRGGQSFVVCPRLLDMADLQEKIATIAPELKVATAHGQMSPGDLENVMSNFYDRKYDVLLSTTIIESGLDIPSVNTLIIHRADMFGLAALYQLRGRVGRSKLRGYAYLTLRPGKVLTATAQRRLEVMSTLDKLGAGFSLASHDLDIRGAGNLIGEEQSGHVKEVGIELYQQMLEEAVNMANTSNRDEIEVEETWSPKIEIGMPVLIPDTYVTDLTTRLGLYRRMAQFEEQKEIEAFAAELIDRFGKLPDEVENLFEVLTIKRLCKIANIEKVEVGPKGALVSLYKGKFASPDKLLAWIGKSNGVVSVRADQKIFYKRAFGGDKDKSLAVKRLVKNLASLVT
ncbi:MAG: TRCF domain-containing protein, partial [Alphaproteobacteria bacterium]